MIEFESTLYGGFERGVHENDWVWLAHDVQRQIEDAGISPMFFEYTGSMRPSGLRGDAVPYAYSITARMLPRYERLKAFL